MSIFPSFFGSFNDIFDNMLINLLDLKELFALIQVNKYYNSKITNVLPTYLASGRINENLIKLAIYNNNSTLLNIVIPKIANLNIYERERVLCIAYKYTNVRTINYMFSNELCSISNSRIDPLLFFACVKGNTVGVKHIINNYGMDKMKANIVLCIAAYYNHKDIFNIADIHHYYDVNTFFVFGKSYRIYRTHPFILALSNRNYKLAQYIFDKYDINTHILDIALQTINLQNVALQITDIDLDQNNSDDNIMHFINKMVIKYSKKIQYEKLDKPLDIIDFHICYFLDYLKQATMF